MLTNMPRNNNELVSKQTTGFTFILILPTPAVFYVFVDTDASGGRAGGGQKAWPREAHTDQVRA